MLPGARITLRLQILEPPPDVRWAIQLGRDQLLPPIHVSRDALLFEVPLTLGPNLRGMLQLRGDAIQGPPAARFVYVNSGKRAGASGSCWDRRAKVPLVSIDVAALQDLQRDVVLEGAICGTARDGGPACASVALIDNAWKLRAVNEDAAEQ